MNSLKSRITYLFAVTLSEDDQFLRYVSFLSLMPLKICKYACLTLFCLSNSGCIHKVSNIEVQEKTADSLIWDIYKCIFYETKNIILSNFMNSIIDVHYSR